MLEVCGLDFSPALRAKVQQDDTSWAHSEKLQSQRKTGRQTLALQLLIHSYTAPPRDSWFRQPEAKVVRVVPTTVVFSYVTAKWNPPRWKADPPGVVLGEYGL